MTTLVIGGTGFIGARVVYGLAEQGERVVCLDLLPNVASVASLRDRVKILYGDVTRLDDLMPAIREHKVNRIANLAGILNAEANQMPHTAIRVNAMGGSNVFEATRLLGVERVAYASTIALYGTQDLYGERAVTEEDVAAPTSLYGATKLANDYQAALYRQVYGLAAVGIRPAVVFGHGRTRGEGMWAATFASDPAVGRTAVLPFSADMRASMVYVDDVADLFVRVLSGPAPRHTIYNAGGDTASLGQLAEMVRQFIPTAEFRFGSGYVKLPCLLDSTRAETEFGWRRRPLAERILDHIDSARKALLPGS